MCNFGQNISISYCNNIFVRDSMLFSYTQNDFFSIVGKILLLSSSRWHGAAKIQNLLLTLRFTWKTLVKMNQLLEMLYSCRFHIFTIKIMFQLDLYNVRCVMNNNLIYFYSLIFAEIHRLLFLWIINFECNKIQFSRCSIQSKM